MTIVSNIHRRALLSIAAFTALCVAAAFTVQSGMADSQDTTRDTYLTVETQPLKQQQSYQSEARYPGKVRALRRSQLGFERGGLLADVSVQEGDSVKKGAALARLDQRAVRADQAAAQANLLAAKAARDDAQAALALAQATTDRQKYLLDKGHISQQRYDDANFSVQSAAARLKTARAQIRVAQAQLETVNVALSLSALTAPFDGVVVRRMADEGTVLAPGTPVLDFEESGAREFITGVPFDVVRDVALGSEVLVLLSGQRVRAIVKQKVPALDGSTRTAQLILNLPARSQALSGQVGELALNTTHKDSGFWVPLEALQEGQRGLWSVFIASSNGKEQTATLVRHPVELVYAELGRAYVRGSISDGNQLVTSGLNRLIAGQTVRTRQAATGR